MFVCVYIRRHAYLTEARAYTRNNIRACTYVYVYFCMYVCTYVCIDDGDIRNVIYIYIYIHTHIYIYTCT